MILVWVSLGLMAYFDFSAFKKISTPTILLMANTLLVVAVILAVFKGFLKHNKDLLYGLITKPEETKSQGAVGSLQETNQVKKEMLREKGGGESVLPDLECQCGCKKPETRNLHNDWIKRAIELEIKYSEDTTKTTKENIASAIAPEPIAKNKDWGTILKVIRPFINP